MRLLSYVLFITVAFVLWLALAASVSNQHLIAGAVVAVLAALFFGGRFAAEPAKCFQPMRYVWFCYYIPVFLWECLKANIDVAYRVLDPTLPICPGIVKIKTDLKTDIARAFLANSITMTPGTLSVDLVGDYVYVHWINVRSRDVAEAGEQIAGRFERLLAKIFE